MAVAPWWPGAYHDHIIATCPLLARNSPAVKAGQGTLNPDSGDVCGWCLRVWRARQARELRPA